MYNFSQLSKAFAALGSKPRLAMILDIAEYGTIAELVPKKMFAPNHLQGLQSTANLALPSVSQHLTKLKSAKLLTVTRAGKYQLVKVNWELLEEIGINFIAEPQLVNFAYKNYELDKKLVASLFEYIALHDFRPYQSINSKSFSGATYYLSPNHMAAITIQPWDKLVQVHYNKTKNNSLNQKVNQLKSVIHKYLDAFAIYPA